MLNWRGEIRKNKKVNCRTDDANGTECLKPVIDGIKKLVLLMPNFFDIENTVKLLINAPGVYLNTGLRTPAFNTDPAFIGDPALIEHWP